DSRWHHLQRSSYRDVAAFFVFCKCISTGSNPSNPTTLLARACNFMIRYFSCYFACSLTGEITLHVIGDE
ncbi:MAG: hypothetical protein WCX48_02430, partial [Bacteroidales bacterium]